MNNVNFTWDRFKILETLKHLTKVTNWKFSRFFFNQFKELLKIYGWQFVIWMYSNLTSTFYKVNWITRKEPNMRGRLFKEWWSNATQLHLLASSATYSQWWLKTLVLALAFQRTRKSHHCHSSLPELSLSPFPFLSPSLSLFHHINSLIIRVQHNVPCVDCVRRTCATICIINIVVVSLMMTVITWCGDVVSACFRCVSISLLVCLVFCVGDE